MLVVLHEGIFKHKIFSRDDDDAILYYEAETRRKCNYVCRRPTTLEFGRFARHFQNLYPYIFKRPLLDLQIINIIDTC